MDEQNKGIEVDITDMQDEAIEAELKTETEPPVVEEQPAPSEEEAKEASKEVEDIKQNEVVEEKPETDTKTEVDKPIDSVESTADVKEEDKVEAPEPKDESEPETEQVTEPEIVEEEVSELDKVKAELEEVKAIREEEKDIKEFETRMRADEIQMDNVRSVLADQLTRALKDIGVDLNTTMEELEKTNPDKAARAKQFLAEAQRIEAYEQQKREQARNERLQEIVFKRAGLFDKYKLTDEESDVAAETFVNILHEVGLKDLDDDLVAKVELAVGRTKLLVDRAKGVVKEVKDIAKEAVDIVNDVMTPAPEVNPDEEKVKEELAKEETAKKDELEPTIDVAAFEEGAPSTVSTPIGEKKDILAELESITSTKERVAFYSEHAKEIEAALKKKYNK